MIEQVVDALSGFGFAPRLVIAAVLGAVIGLDREFRDRPAGLRTHMLTSLAACVFTLITLELHRHYSSLGEQVSTDPIRIIEAVTAGVAFLAAGTIITSRGKVEGLTTGAGMWLAGAVGVASGAGYFALACCAVILSAVIIGLLRPLEKWLNDAVKGAGETDDGRREE